MVVSRDALRAMLVQGSILRTRTSKFRPAPSIFTYPGLSSTKPFWTESFYSNHTDIVHILESNYDVILKEYHGLKCIHKKDNTLTSNHSDYKDDHHKLHSGQWDWHSYILKGERQSSFASNCPKTVKVLESLNQPKLMTGNPFSFAFFSTMGSGAEIQPHYGPSNLRIRCHYPLIIPDGDLGMECGGEKITWNPGKPIFFDDAYEHRGK